MQAIDTQDKQFHDGNGTTELGTILPAWWLNQVQSELLGILSAAKITPNKDQTNQLAQAIQALFPSKNFTLTAGNGLTGGGNLTANRTLTLGTPSTINASSTNSVTSTSHTHAISQATTGTAGIVQLYDALNADYTDRALTAAQGKVLNDKITAATAATATLSSSTTTALATKANNTVSITAGNGLAGGGNLTANRTLALGTPSTINASSTNSVTATSHTHAISKATTGAAGIVQLYDGLTGEYSDRSLTAAQGKVLNDKITAAQNTLSNAVLTTGDQTISGSKNFNNYTSFPGITLKNQTTPSVQFCSTKGSEVLQISSQGAQGTHSFDIRTHENGTVTGTRTANFLLPSKTGSHTLATTGDISEAFSLKKSKEGYVKLPNGVLIQWGFASSVSEATGTITFPIAFTSQVFTVNLSQASTESGVVKRAFHCWDRVETTITYFTWNNYLNLTTGGTSSINYENSFSWIAIGV